MTKKIIIVAGPTTSGKTGFSVKLAQDLRGQIINADSLQIYSEIPILSAQPTKEEQSNIPHHLFGYIKGNEEYTVARWIDDARNYINKTDLPIIVGGTGFYLKHLIFGLSSVPETPSNIRLESRKLLAEIGNKRFYELLQELDPEIAAKLEANNNVRILRAYEVIKATGKSLRFWQEKNTCFYPIDSFKLIILQPERELLYKNCNQRFLDMLKLGALEEVEQLLEQNYPVNSTIMKAHGAPELARYLSREWTLDQAIEKAQQVVRNYAKRQTTWFKHQFINPDLRISFIHNPKEEYDAVIKDIREFLISSK